MKLGTVIRTVLAAGALGLASVTVCAQDGTPPPPPPIESQAIGTPVAVTLKTGEVLRGAFGGVADDKIVIDHPVLGKVSIPRAEVTGWAAMPPNAAPAGVGPATPPEPAKPATPPPPPAPTSFLEGWSGSVELGLNGSDGNTERFNIRAGFNAARKVELMETKFTFAYTYATENGNDTEHKGQAELRNDWLLGKDSPWRIYALGRVEYDQFQNWNWRVSTAVGVGYELFKDDKTTLIGRVGIGAYDEFGGSDNRIHPELDLGLDFEHKFTDRQKFTLTFDYYADLLRITDYRASAKAAYEILLDPDSGLALKLGVDDRYDSTPDGSKRNDIDYFALLVLKF